MIQQKAVITNFTQNEAGAWFMVHVPDWTPETKLSDKCELWLNDGRSISTGQCRFAHALLDDIKNYFGWSKKETKATLKYEFISEKEVEYFSLSDTDMTTARNFIDFIIEFMFENGVRFSDENIPLLKSFNSYYYMCLMTRQCCVCGDLYAHVHHHVNLVGMGGNRTKKDHTKSEFMALCGVHHQEVDTIGHKSFEKKYLVKSIKLTRKSLDKLGIKGEYEDE